MSTTGGSVTFGMVPHQRWCGVAWPHAAHRYAAGNSLPMWADCPGSTACSCNHIVPVAADLGVALPEPGQQR